MVDIRMRWRNVSDEVGMAVRQALLAQGAQERPLAGPHDVWRLRLHGANVAFWDKGTLYLVASGPPTPEAMAARNAALAIAGPPFAPTTAEFLVGFDESGKSEIAGDAILVGVCIPSGLVDEVEAIVGTAETKSRHPPDYFHSRASALAQLEPAGMISVVARISPSEIDRYNVNGLFDVTYARIASSILDRLDDPRVRIAADDYRIGGPFKARLEAARHASAEVFVESEADNRFIEARAASIIARHERELVVAAMNTATWLVGGVSVGAGHADHAQTKLWLERWKASAREWPPFVRRSSAPVRALDGTPLPTKPYPPGWATSRNG